MRHMKRITLILGALLVTAACQDLDVTYHNAPTTERALSSPESVDFVIAGAFSIWWGRMHNSGDVYNYYPDASGAFARTWMNRSLVPGQEPRVALENDPEHAQVWIPRATWDGFASGAANANDALRVMQNGMQIRIGGEDHHDRAYVFARLWQGINLGYLALVHDRHTPADENTDPSDLARPIEWEGANLTMYDVALPGAIEKIERAIEVAETGDQWITPVHYIRNSQYTNEQVVQFAHTMIARLLVLNARTPQERAQVDWAKVQFHAERGLDFDFGPELESGVLTTTGWGQRVFRPLNNAQMFRVGPRVLGMADVSGAYHDWLATDLDQREGFLVESPDRRVVGPGGSEDPGSLVHRQPPIINPDRGTYLESLYGYWGRGNLISPSWTAGLMPIAKADENRLYLAEAYLRQGQTQAAADLINVTRTRAVSIAGVVVDQDLPPVTADGVPQSDDCVPRARFGAAPMGECGTLEDALFYERSIELMGIDPLHRFLDFRGFEFLPEGQLYHMPVPGRYLVSMAQPVYTFGGVGGDGAAAGPP
jgi:hypothetical protein